MENRVVAITRSDACMCLAFVCRPTGADRAAYAHRCRFCDTAFLKLNGGVGVSYVHLPRKIGIKTFQKAFDAHFDRAIKDRVWCGHLLTESRLLGIQAAAADAAFGELNYPPINKGKGPAPPKLVLDTRNDAAIAQALSEPPRTIRLSLGGPAVANPGAGPPGPPVVDDLL